MKLKITDMTGGCSSSSSDELGPSQPNRTNATSVHDNVWKTSRQCHTENCSRLIFRGYLGDGANHIRSSPFMHELIGYFQCDHFSVRSVRMCNLGNAGPNYNSNNKVTAARNSQNRQLFDISVRVIARLSDITTTGDDVSSCLIANRN